MNPPVPTQRILYSVARRVGLEPIGNDANLSVSKTREILEFIDTRLKEAWELYDFVETTFVEERAFAPDYDPKASYCQGDVVWDWCSRYYYKALAPTIGGSLSNAAVWQQNVSPLQRLILYWQPCHTRIGTVFSAWNKNPYTDPNRIKLDYLLDNPGIWFAQTPAAPPQTVWLQFRIPYPGIALDAWNDTEIYNTGDAAYYNMDTYLSLIDNNVGNMPPSVSDNNWQQFRIPWVFRTFVTQAAFSDTLIVAGQNEKAPDQLQQAYQALWSEFDKQTLQSGQFQGYSARVR